MVEETIVDANLNEKMIIWKRVVVRLESWL